MLEKMGVGGLCEEGKGARAGGRDRKGQEKNSLSSITIVTFSEHLVQRAPLFSAPYLLTELLPWVFYNIPRAENKNVHTTLLS